MRTRGTRRIISHMSERQDDTVGALPLSDGVPTMATAAAGYAAAAVVGRTPPHLLESVSYRASSVAGSPPREPAAPEGNGPLVLPPGWAEERKGVRPAASMP